MTNAVSPNDPDTSALAAILFGELEAALFTQLIHAVGRQPQKIRPSLQEAC
jgi:hypothetical protein